MRSQAAELGCWQGLLRSWSGGRTWIVGTGDQAALEHVHNHAHVPLLLDVIQEPAGEARDWVVSRQTKQTEEGTLYTSVSSCVDIDKQAPSHSQLAKPTCSN